MCQRGGWEPQAFRYPIETIRVKKRIVETKPFRDRIASLTQQEKDVEIYNRYWDVLATLSNPKVSAAHRQALIRENRNILKIASPEMRRRINAEVMAWRHTKTKLKKSIPHLSKEERYQKHIQFLRREDPERLEKQYIYDLETVPDFQTIYDE